MPGDLACHRFTEPEGPALWESVLVIDTHQAQMPGWRTDGISLFKILQRVSYITKK